jgi:O-antigen ligase
MSVVWSQIVAWCRRLKSLEGGLVLLAAMLLPWQARYIKRVGDLAGVPWEQGTVSLFATEVVILVALLVHVVRRPPTVERLESPWYLRLWALFLLFAGLSISWARVPTAALFTWVRLFEGFALAYLIWQSRLGLRTLAAALVVGNVPNALLGVWQFLAQSAFASTWLGVASHLPTEAGASVVETATGRFLRAYGLLPHPNLFGAFMAAALVLAVALALTAVTVRAWRSWTLLATLFLVGLVVSFSRSAILAAGVTFLLAFWRRRSWGPVAQGYFRRSFAVLVIVTALLIMALGPIMTARTLGVGRLEGQSISERILSINQGVQLLWAHPELGVGLGNFQVAAYDETEPKLVDAYGYQPAHFVPILVGAELGVFGLFLLLGAVWLWAIEVRGYRPLLASPLESAALILPIIPIVAGCFDHWPLTAYAGILLTGVLFGLSLKAERSA